MGERPNIEEPVTESPLFEVLIDREGRTFAPRSLGEVEAWLQEQQAFWSWVVEAKRDDPAIDYVINTVYWPLNNISDSLNRVKESDPQRTAQRIEELRSHLDDHLTGRRMATSETPFAQFVSELAKTDKVVAAHALWALLGNDPQGTNRPARALRGQILASLHSIERDSLTPAARGAWTKTQQRVNNEHEVLRKEAGKIADNFRALSDEISELHVDQKRIYDEAHAKRSNDFEAQKEKHGSEMKQLEDTFKRELSLRSAVQYLDDKAARHKKAAKGAGIAAGIVGFVLAVLAIVVALVVFKSGSQVPFPQVAVAVLMATLFFWVLRILVRVLLSNLHLETDMRARSTFVHTYLALLAEGGGIKDEDRALVIGLVFRPISDGLVRDDATPPGMWDLVTKNLSGRG